MDFTKDILPVIVPLLAGSGGTILSIANETLILIDRFTKGKSLAEKAKIEREFFKKLTDIAIEVGNASQKDVTEAVALSNKLAESV